MPQCQVCGNELKLIPAGISKNTGKPYNAFYSCPNRCQQPKAPQAPNSQEPHYVPNTPTFSPKPQFNPSVASQATPGVDWEKISFGKCKFGFLEKSFIPYLKGEIVMTEDELEEKAENFAHRAMRMNNPIFVDKIPF